MTASICFVIPYSNTVRKKYEYTAKSQQTTNELIMTSMIMRDNNEDNNERTIDIHEYS